ncbi:biotin-dependent carboxyltransferase family protein [Streptomyces sp. NPDC016845]|uniref:biotin-dependent carboxyltransferase family protein n=1 Tax=Streptomyces sp. NPDC016845 TaxID=3364972 RepID=UPI00378A67A1
MTTKLTVTRPGALTTIQDAGRPGHAHLGVPRSGALDAPSMDLANRLLGNPEGAAVLETSLTGCALRPDADITVVIGGAPCPVTVNGRPAPWGTPVRVPAGATLDAGPATAGIRTYVAIAGGIAADPVLGSRSTDLLSGLGPAPLAQGDLIPVARTTRTAPPALPVAPPWPAPPAELVLPARFGPRADWFTDTARRTFLSAAYSVSVHSNRIGLRTEGPALERATEGELPSEGMVLGAVQVPPDGRPVVFLHDHPTTGGYPVIAVVEEEALAAAAQAVPGTPVRFAPC